MALVAASGLAAVAPSSLAAACLVPPPGIVAWWPGDGHTRDVVGGSDGTLVGGASFGPGVAGDAFSLDGVDDYVGVGDPAALRLTGSFSLDAWVYYSRALTRGEVAAITGKWNHLIASDAFGLSSIEVGGVIQIVAGVGDGRTPDNWPAGEGREVRPNAWTHVATTYDAATGKNAVFVDGVEVGSRNRPGGTQFSNVNFIIGAQDLYWGVDRFFPGFIDEPKVFDRALGADEIRAVFEAGSAGYCKQMPVTIDIKPGGDPNSVNCDSAGGVVPVALFSEADFDATDVYPDSLTLEGVRVSVPSGRVHPGDGDEPSYAVVHLSKRDVCEATAALPLRESVPVTLAGTLQDGRAFQATDTIRIVKR